MDPLSSEEAISTVMAVRIATASRDDYRKLTGLLANRAAPYEPGNDLVTVATPEVAKWFEDNDIPYRLAADAAADE